MVGGVSAVVASKRENQSCEESGLGVLHVRRTTKNINVGVLLSVGGSGKQNETTRGDRIVIDGT